jgi:excisionase family DNA binding protein
MNADKRRVIVKRDMEHWDILTVSLVANYLNLTEEEVMRLVNERKIPCARLAGKFLFVKKQILEWVASETRKQESEYDDDDPDENG